MKRLSPYGAVRANHYLLIIFLLSCNLTFTASMIGTRRQSAMARELEQIRLLNKKNHQAERQLQEEEEKKTQDEEEARRRAAEPVKDSVSTVDLQSTTVDDAAPDFSSTVRQIMDGLDDMETEDRPSNESSEPSPLKKRGGSSKAPSRRRSPVCQVSPNEVEPTTIGKPATCVTSFLDKHVHIHKRTIILLTSEKKFEEFTRALMAFLTNAQMVDPKFVINPLNPESKGKDITSKGEISPNMTKLGEHVKI